MIVRKHYVRHDEQPENALEILKPEKLFDIVGFFNFVGNKLLDRILQEVGIIFIFCSIEFSWSVNNILFFSCDFPIPFLST